MQVDGEPVPSAAGTSELFTLTGLTAATTYHFAIKSADEVPNTSGLSNVPSFTTSPAPPTSGFNFLVYGDNRAGGGCVGNGEHIALVGRMAAEPADLTLHVGDMIAGATSLTNWTQNGSCTGSSSFGSFKDQIGPLQNKAAAAGLPAFFFPVFGNHDDNWGSGWYPDPFGAGVCDAFSGSLLQTLIPNHTTKPYFQDTSERNYPIYSDAEFYSLLCSTSTSAVYSEFAYYSFNYQNTHFVVLRVNNDNQDLKTCNNCADQADYDDYHGIHQLHWLQNDLAQANADPSTRSIVAFLHAPVFTSAQKHAANDSWQYLAQEFSNYGVDLVFAGHNHVYERTVPIRVDAANPNGVQDDITGTTYVVTGGGGSPLSGFNSPQWFDVTRTSAHHYMRVNVAGGTITVEAVDSNGAVIDAFVVQH